MDRLLLCQSSLSSEGKVKCRRNRAALAATPNDITMTNALSLLVIVTPHDVVANLGERR